MKNKPSILVGVAVCCVLVSCQGVTENNSASFDASSIGPGDCSYGGLLKSIEAPDAHTVIFTLCRPDPAFPAKIANPAFAILDSDYLDRRAGSSENITDDPVGTGPYKVSTFTETGLSLSKNDLYWGVPAKSDKINFSWVNDPINRLVPLWNGTIDIVNEPPPNTFTMIANNPNLNLTYRSGYNVYFIGINTSIAPFDKLENRRGLAYALDRESIVADEFPTGAVVADQFVPQTLSPGYSANLKWYDYNFGSANVNFTAGLFDYAQTIYLYYEKPLKELIPDPGDVAYAITTQLHDDFGLNLVPRPLDSASFLANIQEGQLGIFLMKLDASYPDAIEFYNTTFLQNTVYFGDLDADFLSSIEQAGLSDDAAIRQERYNLVNNYIRDQVIVIPVAHINTAVASSVTVDNLVAGPFTMNLSKVTSSDNDISIAQQSKPVTLAPMDESDPDTFRATSLIYDTLVNYDLQGKGVTPGLADSWYSNADLTEWTFVLHFGAKYSNGADFDARDVLGTFEAIWDEGSENHTGNTGTFLIFKQFFGAFYNSQAQ